MKTTNLEFCLERHEAHVRSDWDCGFDAEMERIAAAKAELASIADLSGVEAETVRCLRNMVAITEAIQAGRDYEPIDLFTVIREAKAVLAMKGERPMTDAEELWRHYAKRAMKGGME